MWRVYWNYKGLSCQSDPIEADSKAEALWKAEALHPSLKKGQQIEATKYPF